MENGCHLHLYTLCFLVPRRHVQFIRNTLFLDLSEFMVCCLD